MISRRTFTPAVAGVFAALVVTVGNGNASAATLDRDATRRTVEQLVHTTYPTLGFGNIACPSGLARRRGAQFTCTVQLPGAFLVLTGRETDARGTVAFASDQVLLSRDALQQFVAQNSSIDSLVDCGAAPWRTARVGVTIGCAVLLADGSSRHVDLSVRDAEGTVAIIGVT
jgi:hypothetical protein